MPPDSRKREKKLLKRRRKAKEAARKRNVQVSAVASPPRLIREARKSPLWQCWISSDWDKEHEGMLEVSVSRQQPDGGIVFGVYLLDVFCLGLKDTFCNANFTQSQYQREVIGHLNRAMPVTQCAPELAHQIIYQAIDYASQYGFKPQKDFKLSQFVLEERGALPEPYSLTFGKNGKPFYISGPYDNTDAIIAKLEATAGHGNYECMLILGDPSSDFSD